MRDEEISIVTGLHRREKECNKLEEADRGQDAQLTEEQPMGTAVSASNT